MTDSTIIPPQLNYSRSGIVCPNYQFTTLLTVSGGNSFQISAAGTEVLIELPVRAMNLSRSHLYFQIGIVDTGATYNNLQLWMNSGAFAPFRQMQLYTRSNTFVSDIYELQNYTNMVWLPQTKLQDFLTFDQGLNCGAGSNTFATPNKNGFIQYLQPSYLNLPNLANHRTDNSLPQLTGYENLHFYASNAVGNQNGQGTLILNVMFPLKLIYDSIFSIDKDILFNEIMVLRLVFNGSNRFSFTTTAGDLTNPTANPAVPGGNISVQNLKLYLAVEQNLAIENELRAKIASPEGMSMLIPYIYTTKLGLPASSSQSLTIRYNRGHGLRLKKLFYAPYNTTEQLNTSFDHSNINGSKISSFYTQIDSTRLQQYNVDCTNAGGQSQDYLEMKKYLLHSCLPTDNLYQYNWFWLDSFEEQNPLSDDIEENTICGLDLSTERQYEVIATTQASGVPPAYPALNHYVFAITQKMMTINSNGIIVS